MLTFTIKRNGKTVLSGGYWKQKVFFQQLYWRLLFKYSDGETVERIIRRQYVLTDNYTNTKWKIFF